jgi:hypothetical protein
VNARVEALLSELESMHSSDTHPFPYDDCRKLIEEDPLRYSALIPDLDVYFALIAGYRRSGSRILNWPLTRLEDAQHKLGRSLYERYPAYNKLRELSPERAPALVRELANAEKARKILVEVFDTVNLARRPG